MSVSISGSFIYRAVDLFLLEGLYILRMSTLCNISPNLSLIVLLYLC